ncbi:MAG: hypothetical protein HYY76_09785 [Acidobacteria bacterium]|nr:hypothetical protein [Acidobacteriota bacterium]
MRLSSCVAVLVLWSSSSTFAQDWIEFASRQDGFTCNFPGQPTVTETTYRSQFGADLPARVYSAQQGQSRYSITVADFSRIEQILTEKAKACPAGAETCRGGGSSTGPGYWRADYNGAIIYATWERMQRAAKVSQFLWNNVNLVGGHQLHLTNPDGSRSVVGIYMHNQKLYILEGTAPEGYPEPGMFPQSLGWLDENGEGIRYRTLYHHAFPPPPVDDRNQDGPGRINAPQRGQRP